MDSKKYSRICPKCGQDVYHKTDRSCKWANKIKRLCRSCAYTGRECSIESREKMSLAKIGKPTWASLHKDDWSKRMSGKNHPMYGKHHTDEMREKQRLRLIGTKLSDDTKRKLSESVKLAMYRPDVRKKHIQGLIRSPWLKVKTDKGQLELIEKWNKLGFKFEPNYQIHTDTDLFYVDGYDKEHNVVLEYDGKYHNKTYQKMRDLVRQQKIIDIIHPKKFWRYNGMYNSFIECINNKNTTTVVVEQ